MPVPYTHEQRLAIETENAAQILVSAAAGSGKTFVLAERILRHLTGKKNATPAAGANEVPEAINGHPPASMDKAAAPPADIGELLVVTFTEAAAEEMRERVAQKITERLAANPNDAHLARQLARLPSARISTIHAFCRRLVKEHFQWVNLDPMFRVGDETELSLLKSQAMDELFDEEYEKENNESFLDLADAFGGKTRDDGLDSLVRGLHAFLENCAYPEEAATEYTDLFARGAADLDATPWAAVVRDEIRDELTGALECVQIARGICALPNGPIRYTAALDSDEKLIERLAGSLDKPFAALYDHFKAVLDAPGAFARLHTYRAADEVSVPLKERVKRIRDKDIKARLKDLYTGCFFAAPEKMRADMAGLHARVEALMELTLKFRRRYAAEKRLRNLLDFNDLEHFAIQILIPHGPGDPSPGPAAQTLRAAFREVLTDEYQDSNGIQEIILKDIAPRRFMVGDVKQSIYRFRRAEPGLFVQKYEEYRPAEGIGDGMRRPLEESIDTPASLPLEKSINAPASPPLEKSINAPALLPPEGPGSAPAPPNGVRIDLSRNFRSREQVLDTVNFFFTQLMSPEVGDVRYDEHAALYPGAAFPPAPEGASFHTIIDLAVDEYAENPPGGTLAHCQSPAIGPAASGPPESPPAVNPPSLANPAVNRPGDTAGDPETDEELSALEREAAMIAARIHGLTGRQPVWDASLGSYRPCRLGDIVVLVRSAASVAAPLAEALKRQDIDAAADQATGFFETQEIQTALAFLRVTDNPRQDIELLTVLNSPVYRFTPDELMRVREMDGEADYYVCMRLLAEKYAAAGPGHEPPDGVLTAALCKCRAFLSDLERWRAQAAYLPVSRLLNIIYHETRYPALCVPMPGGRIRQANLRLLVERAIEYEETSLKGLFNFVRYIEKMKKAGGAGSVTAAQAQDFAETRQRVRVMTIHKAKGLEFPIVFVSLLGRAFNREDERKSVALHQRYGLGPEYVDLETRTRSNTLARLALAKLARRESLSEELRVLYVALTRAKELLVLTGCVSHYDKKRADWASLTGRTETWLPVYYRRECNNYLDWLMPCVARHRDGFAPLRDESAVACANDDLYNHAARFDLNIHATNNINAIRATNDTGLPRPADNDNKQNTLPAPAVSYIPIAVPVARRNCVIAVPDEHGLGGAENSERLTAFSATAQADARQNCAIAVPDNLPSKVSVSELKRLYALETTPDSGPLYDGAGDAPVFEPPGFIKAEQGMTAARVGTVLHTLAEHIDLRRHGSPEGAAELISGLTARHILTPEEAEAVDQDKILRFAQSKLAGRMRAALEVHRETPFVMALPAREVYRGGGRSPSEGQDWEQLAHETILTHGIIDCYFQEDDGIVLVDYKSDFFTGDPQAWARRHLVQMGLYKKAVERATGKKVKETLLYSFTLNDTVPITVPD